MEIPDLRYWSMKSNNTGPCEGLAVHSRARTIPLSGLAAYLVEMDVNRIPEVRKYNSQEPWIEWMVFYLH